MPRAPKTHHQDLRDTRPQMFVRSESDQDRARRMADPAQVEANRIRHTAAWIRARDLVLMEEPFCLVCLALGLTTKATQVDHIEPLAARPDLATHRSNLQGLCTACHALKSTGERRRAADRALPDGGDRKYSSSVDSEAPDA